MELKTVVILFIVLLAGCAFHSGPERNLEFYQISQLSELEGVYKNKGNPSGYLSTLIWPEIKQIISADIKHEDIDFIEIISEEKSLIVKAIVNGCAIYEKTYILDRDFKISDGKILVHRETHAYTRGGYDPFLGPSYEDVTLGLDVGKHGKSRSKEYFAGLVYLFPVAASNTSDIRYERVRAEPQGFQTCINR